MRLIVICIALIGEVVSPALDDTGGLAVLGRIALIGG
jgi:hypothetical protein